MKMTPNEKQELHELQMNQDPSRRREDLETKARLEAVELFIRSQSESKNELPNTDSK